MTEDYGRRPVRPTVFLFGEAEKGEFCTPLVYRNLPQLAESLGNPPEDSLGIMYAVQTLLYDRTLIFYRVKEEGFSIADYMKGLKLLQHTESELGLSAICMPGVGDATIINASAQVCALHKSCLIINEQDLYDFLTTHPQEGIG